MNRVIGLRLATVTSGLLLLMAAGCTNSDPLTPSSGRVQLELRIQNPDPRWEFQEFGIRQIRLRPTDEQAQEVLGNATLGLLSGQRDLVVDFTGNTGVGDEGVRNLKTGEYVVAAITLSAIRLEDFDAPPPGTCEEMVTFYPPQDLATVLLDDVIRIGPEGETLKLTFDGVAFVEAYRSSWFGCTGPSDPGFFLEFTFADLGDTFIQVN